MVGTQEISRFAHNFGLINDPDDLIKFLAGILAPAYIEHKLSRSIFFEQIRPTMSDVRWENPTHRQDHIDRRVASRECVWLPCTRPHSLAPIFNYSLKLPITARMEGAKGCPLVFYLLLSLQINFVFSKQYRISISECLDLF